MSWKQRQGRFDGEHGVSAAGFASWIEIDLTAMVLDDLFRDRETESVPISLSITDERLEDGLLNRFGDAWIVIPRGDLQAGSGSDGCYDDLSRFRRNRFAGIAMRVRLVLLLFRARCLPPGFLRSG